jgi:signal transduction histidine kinase
MAGLGTLAAGLAHELNNPAAALARSADQLRDALQSWEEASAGASEGAAIAATLQRWGKAGGREGGTDPLELSEREEQISEWLEHEGVSDPWDIAGGLAEAGFNPAQLAGLVADVPPADRAARLEWLSRGLAVRKLVGEIGMSAGRISEIVRAVKSYAYLDQAPIQEVDLHAGLDDTLVILRRKLEPGIQVRRAYAPGLPKIEAFGSELNQVWTNLIDNAAQAMQGQGELNLATARRGEDVEVRICDSGPGIPEAVRSRIFEPFFTTKAPGEGTGLGLHLVYNIVVLHHHGKVDVESAPGRTCFTITLPIQRPRGENER